MIVTLQSLKFHYSIPGFANKKSGLVADCFFVGGLDVFYEAFNFGFVNKGDGAATEADAAMELEVLKNKANLFNPADRKKLIKALTAEMTACADRMEYEQAAALRDQIREIEAQYGK